MQRMTQLATALGALAIVVGACGGGASPTPAPATTAPEGTPAPTEAVAYQGEITFWNTMRDFELVEVQKLVDAWTAEHPGITVKMDPVPFDGADVKYDQAATGKTAPDIFRADIGWTPTFADAGYLLDLTGKIDNVDDFLNTPLATNKWNGKLYGVPQVTDALGLQCNGKLLAAAGLSAPPTTWAQLVEKGKAVTDLAAQKYGFYMRGDSYWAQPFIWGWGGTLFEVDDQGLVTVTVDSPESEKGFNYLKDSILGTVAPASWDFASDYDNMNAGFKGGTTMCILQGPWQVADLLTGDAFKDDPNNLVIAPVPDGEAGLTGSPVGGHNYVVYALVADDSAKEAAVLSLLNYLSTAESQAALASSVGLLPTRTSAYEIDSVKSDPKIADWRAVLAKATNRSGVPGASNIYKPFTDNYQLFLKGDKTAAQALADMATAWETTVFQDRLAK
jgi:arabinogalactan oligomer/maltooligosaccharide transport system substrate-binding protein